MSLVYFAYGSNMSTARLEKRIGPVAVIGKGVLSSHSLRFHKHSKKDQTGKCDAFFTGTPDDRVIGVLFSLSAQQKPTLDDFEGLGKGYDEKTVSIQQGDKQIEATTYVASANAIDPSLRPLKVYRQYVLDGAQEHGLPQDYIHSFINAVQTID